MIKGWRYYNHAMLSTGAPQDEVNLKPLEDGTIWKQKGYPLFVRYVSDYDCGHPTEWWYCLKDSEYRIDTLNAKKDIESQKAASVLMFDRLTNQSTMMR